jgi:hypothetical protein
LLVFEEAGTTIDTSDLAARAGERLALLRVTPESDPDGDVHARYNQRGPGWVLIRPDLVVAARASARDLSLLDRYVDRVLRAPRGAPSKAAPRQLAAASGA